MTATADELITPGPPPEVPHLAPAHAIARLREAIAILDSRVAFQREDEDERPEWWSAGYGPGVQNGLGGPCGDLAGLFTPEVVECITSTMSDCLQAIVREGELTLLDGRATPAYAAATRDAAKRYRRATVLAEKIIRAEHDLHG